MTEINKKWNRTKYLGHTEELKKRVRNYVKLNPEKSKAWSRKSERKRRAFKEKLNENFSVEDEKFTRKLWNNRCAIYGRKQSLKEPNFHIDHWMPLSKGYVLTRSNAVLMCPSCNTSKKDFLPGSLFSEEVTLRVEEKLRIA